MFLKLVTGKLGNVQCFWGSNFLLTVNSCTREKTRPLKAEQQIISNHCRHLKMKQSRCNSVNSLISKNTTLNTTVLTIV